MEYRSKGVGAQTLSPSPAITNCPIYEYIIFIDDLFLSTVISLAPSIHFHFPVVRTNGMHQFSRDAFLFSISSKCTLINMRHTLNESIKRSEIIVRNHEKRIHAHELPRLPRRALIYMYILYIFLLFGLFFVEMENSWPKEEKQKCV